MKKLVEIRSYKLKVGSRDKFDGLVREQSLPLMKKRNVDVITFGPSRHDSESYYLFRAYKDMDDRRVSQDAFYDSTDWLQGPREAIISLVESDVSIVIEMEVSAIDALRGVDG